MAINAGSRPQGVGHSNLVYRPMRSDVPWGEFVEQYRREKSYQKTIDQKIKEFTELGEFAGIEKVSDFTADAIHAHIDWFAAAVQIF